MHCRTAFRSYFLARLLLCLTLLAQASMASAAPSSWVNRAGPTTQVPADIMRPSAASSLVLADPIAHMSVASCAPSACEIYLPWLVAGVPPSATPTASPTAPPLSTPIPPTPTPIPPTPTPIPPTPSVGDIEPPNAPVNLRATNKTATTVSLVWDAAADNVAVTEYALYSGSALILTTTDLFATISALSASTTYTFTLIARDTAGNFSPASAPLEVTTDSTAVLEDYQAPTAPAHLRARRTTHGTIALAWDASTDDVAVAEYAIYDNDTWIDWTTETSFTITNLSAASDHFLKVAAYDTSWHLSDSSDTLHIITDIPPDSAAVAPTVDQTVASDIASDTAFIYSGADPIQSGVATGTIQAQRVAILRGRVITRDGAAIPAVHISVLDHPEYGGTASRDDGAFDLAVNGGGPLTVDYKKAGYLPAQRQVVAPWRDYVTLPEVALVALDRAVTTISLDETSSLQAAAGSVVSDTDGVRQALLIFPANTTATLTLPDGSEQSLTTLHVRATEYTVGERGPQAMPGTLPVESGYTYAVDYSVDEALAAGARQVRFSQPVIGYVENFLDFPVGEVVPAGYYDRERATWIASDSGLIVKIVGVTDGLADLDLNGYGPADDPSQLGISDAEREQLAGRYAVGQELWRVPISHFTPWDFN